MNNDNNMGNTNLVQNQANMQVNTSMNNQQVPSANIYIQKILPRMVHLSKTKIKEIMVKRNLI